MQTRTLGQKLKSTKLWALIAGMALGAAMYFGAEGNTIQTVASAVLELASIITYIVTEGKIDAQAVAHTIMVTGEAIEAIMGDDEDDEEEKEEVEIP